MNSNRTKSRNNAAASNENAILQEVNINIGGGATAANADGTGGDCYTRGECGGCKSTDPYWCPIVRKHLKKEEPPAEPYFYQWGG